MACLDDVLGRYVAVKALAARLAADPAFPRRLLAVTVCAQLASALQAAHGQFEAMLTITNATSASIPKWTVAFSQPGVQSISSTQTGQAEQQVVVKDAVAHISQQGQTVTLTGASTLDAGASVTQILHGRHTSQAGGMPGAFTLNGRRCDTTIILDAAAPPRPRT